MSIGFGHWLGLDNDKGKDLFCSLGTFSVYQSLLVGFYLLFHVTSLLLKLPLNPYLRENKHHSLQQLHLFVGDLFKQWTPQHLPLLLLLIVIRDITWIKKSVCSAVDFFTIFLLEKVKQFGCHMKKMIAIHVLWFVWTRIVFSALKRNNARVKLSKSCLVSAFWYVS